MSHTEDFELYFLKSVNAALIRPCICVSTVAESTSQRELTEFHMGYRTVERLGSSI